MGVCVVFSGLGRARGQHPPLLRAGAATGSCDRCQSATTRPPAPPLKSVVGLLRHFDWRLRTQEPFQRTATPGIVHRFFPEACRAAPCWLSSRAARPGGGGLIIMGTVVVSLVRFAYYSRHRITTLRLHEVNFEGAKVSYSQVSKDCVRYPATLSASGVLSTNDNKSPRH